MVMQMTVPGPHACRAAADDLNTALGGDLKLTAFGPRLPELSREAELLLFVRRVLGEFVHTVTISWSASPSGDDPARSILAPVVHGWHTKMLDAPIAKSFGSLRKDSQLVALRNYRAILSQVSGFLLLGDAIRANCLVTDKGVQRVTGAER